MKVSFRLSNKGQPILEFQNETFYRHRSGKCTPIVTWRYVRYNEKCQARLQTIDDEIVGSATLVHSHGTFGKKCAGQNYVSESDETVSNSSQSEETESNSSETEEMKCNSSESEEADYTENSSVR